MLDFLVSPHGEHYLPELQRGDLVDRVSAEVFEDHFDIDFGADDTLFVIIGSDSGLLARWLGTQCDGDGSRLLFIELDDYHAPIVERSGEILDGERLRMIRASDVDTELDPNELTRWLYGGQVVLVESMASHRNRSEHYAELARGIRARLGEMAYNASVHLNGQLFLHNALQNLTENRIPASTVGTIGTGHTAVILGGGPSLDEHLDWVREHRDRLFLFAVSRIASRLTAAGIVPDVIVAVDPLDILYDISKHALSFDDTLLVTSYHLAPQLQQQWPGPQVHIGHAVPWENKLGVDEGNIQSHGSTVTHSATWVASCWGFSQILLSGFDLCYAPGGATHASGSVESLCAGMLLEYTAHVDTYNGRRAGTSVGLKVACEELDEIGRAIRTAGNRVYNLAADAARIASIEQRDVADVVLGGPRPCVPVLEGRRSEVEHWNAIGRELVEANRGLRALRSECRKAQALLDGLHGRNGRARDPGCKRKLDALEQRLEKRQRRWMAMVKRYAVLQLMSTIAPRGFEVQSEEELEAWGRNYYRIIDGAAKVLLGHVGKARERVARRLDEKKAPQDIDGLLDYWDRDRTPGRVRFAIDRTGLDEAHDHRLDEVERRFAEHLKDVDTERVRDLKSQEHDPGRLLCTVSLLHGERQRDDLAMVAQAFDRQGDGYTLLADWAFGQLAELDRDPAAALECYGRIVDHHARLQDAGSPIPRGYEGLLERALLRIADLQLCGDDPTCALDTLSLLTQISPVHANHQASMLAIMGRETDAIQLLNEVLDNGSNDWRVIAHLARLYERSGSTRSADLARSLSRQLRGTARAPESKAA